MPKKSRIARPFGYAKSEPALKFSFQSVDLFSERLGKRFVEKIMATESEGAPAPRRKRSVTSIALGWLAERMRKVDTVRAAISRGQYEVPADSVARAIVKPDEDSPQ